MSAPIARHNLIAVETITFDTLFGEWSVASAPPPPDLALCVAELWEIKGVAGYGYEKLIPRGLADFMINLGPPQHVLQDPTDSDPPIFVNAWLSGIHDAPLLAAPTHGSDDFNTHFVGARLKPEGVAGIFGMDASDVANRVVEAEDFTGPAMRSLRTQLGETPGARGRFSLLAGFLRAQSVKNGRPPSPSALWAIERTLSVGGDIRIDHLCAELEISRKHLNSLYKRAVGLTPKTFARLSRFRMVMDRLEDPAAESWVGIAIDRGYFDHAHLVRDFNQFTGEAPEAFLKNRGPDGESVVYAEKPGEF